MLHFQLQKPGNLVHSRPYLGSISKPVVSDINEHSYSEETTKCKPAERQNLLIYINLPSRHLNFCIVLFCKYSIKTKLYIFYN